MGLSTLWETLHEVAGIRTEGPDPENLGTGLLDYGKLK
jgi:hypothetical protein